jgi:hypothetical protein
MSGGLVCYTGFVLGLRSPLRCLATVLALAPALVLLAPREASAFEHQWHVGADAGYAALITGPGATLHGFGGGLHLTYGISDTLNLLVTGDVTVHPAGKYKGLSVDGFVLAGGNVGVGYVFDILQLVPYVGATAGFYYAAGPTDSGPRLALSIPFGMDYQVSRRFAVGAAGEYKLLLLDAMGTSQRISGFLRAEYIWGF